MIIAINNKEVKTIHAVQMEEINDFIYHIDIEFSDNENKYHHITNDYMDNITVVLSNGSVLQFEFVGLERVHNNIISHHAVYINGCKMGIA